MIPPTTLPHCAEEGVFERILWYSLGQWVAPSVDIQVVHLGNTVTDADLGELTSGPFAYFFEPTPYPMVNSYDPIAMAARLGRVARLTPSRVVAFTSGYSTPVSVEAQAAFAVQAGILLGVMPEIRHVAMPDTAQPARTGKAKSEAGPDFASLWMDALDVAATGKNGGIAIPDFIQKLVALYLAPFPGAARFNPTQRRLLHRASTGEIGVIAEDVARDLSVQLVTAQRAIRGIAMTLYADAAGRRSPELVGQLVAQYGWFFRFNEF